MAPAIRAYIRTILAIKLSHYIYTPFGSKSQPNYLSSQMGLCLKSIKLQRNSPLRNVKFHDFFKFFLQIPIFSKFKFGKKLKNSLFLNILEQLSQKMHRVFRYFPYFAQYGAHKRKTSCHAVATGPKYVLSFVNLNSIFQPVYKRVPSASCADAF